MSLDEFKGYIQSKYGSDGMIDLPARLDRVEATGTSAFHQTIEDVISYNRAGHKEACLSRAELINWYCDKKMTPQGQPDDE